MVLIWHLMTASDLTTSLLLLVQGRCPLFPLRWKWMIGGGGLLRSNLSLGDTLLWGAGYFVTGLNCVCPKTQHNTVLSLWSATQETGSTFPGITPLLNLHSLPQRGIYIFTSVIIVVKNTKMRACASCLFAFSRSIYKLVHSLHFDHLGQPEYLQHFCPQKDTLYTLYKVNMAWIHTELKGFILTYLAIGQTATVMSRSECSTFFVKPSSVTASCCIANSLLLSLLQHVYTHLYANQTEDQTGKLSAG